MSDDYLDPTCAAVAPALPELALGALTGRDRAAALAHVEGCARCGDELEQLSRAADAVVEVAPELDPPVGFEVRVLERMGIAEDRAPAVRRLRPAWLLASAAAVVALATGVGIGWWASPSPRPVTAVGRHAPAAVTTAALLQDGRPVGRVVTTGGTAPWMFMTLDGAAAQGTVTCQVVTDDGATRVVGTFTATNGYGTWGAPLPVAAGDVRRAQVVSAQGTVLATASLS